MKTSRIVVRSVLVLMVLAVAAGVVLFVLDLGRPRVIASAIAPDGTEMCIVQQCNWSPEPFTTSFVYRKPGAAWGRFYYDHEDSYWRTGHVVLEPNQATAVFYRDQAPAVTFRWDSETFTLHRLDRTLTGAQINLPAGWTPDQSVYR